MRDPYDFDDQRVGQAHTPNDEMCFCVGFALGDSSGSWICPNLWDALLTPR